MGWWKTAKPGDKVVCVTETNAFRDLRPWWERLLFRSGYRGVTRGRVYTVDRIVTAPRLDGVHVTLVERPEARGFARCFPAWIFRPVARKSSETGVAALRRWLLRAPERAQP